MTSAANLLPQPCPRLGFVGLGWIGRNRLEAVMKSGLAEVAALADPVEELVRSALAIAPGAEVHSSLDDLLGRGLDGIVIATPSALHAQQSIAVLESGCAAFCQKPLGRNAAETRAVIEAARRANRPLGVDLSYRYTAAMLALRSVVRSGSIGEIYAADLVFHNAYGPDKPWFYDRRLSGGGCLIDLGVHLVDLGLWIFGFPSVESVQGRLFDHGRPYVASDAGVEDYATGEVALAGGRTMRFTCSWNLHAGCDAEISATFYGTDGAVAFRNVNGSFYDFTAELFHKTSRTLLASPPDVWGGRAAVDWADRLATGSGFDPDIEELVDVACILDEIYAAHGVETTG